MDVADFSAFQRRVQYDNTINSFMRLSITNSVCIALSAFIAAITLEGCVVYPFRGGSRDVTSDPIWWGDMHRQEIVAVNEDTLLNGQTLTLAAYKFTGDYDSGVLFGGNITVDMFKANPARYWSDLHLLPKGTRLRFVKLERYWSSEYSAYVISAEIVDGDYAGRVVVVPCGRGDIHKRGSLHMTSDIVHRVD